MKIERSVDRWKVKPLAWRPGRVSSCVIREGRSGVHAICWVWISVYPEQYVFLDVMILYRTFWCVCVYPGPGAIAAGYRFPGPREYTICSVYLAVKMAAAWRWPAGQWRHDF